MTVLQTVAAIKAAYAAARDRLSRLSTTAFLAECLAFDWAGLPPDTRLQDALASMAREGAIDAAAALRVLAEASPDITHLADAAFVALLLRNKAAADELVEIGLVALVEEAAAGMGYVPVVDPETGETRWRAP